MESYNGIVQTPREALLLLEASRIGLIPRIKRRLKEVHRRNITPGQVFIWNEREAKMRRWTDGRSWSASRVTGTFLTYKEMETKEDLGSSYKYKTDGLIKQSFSITTTQGDKLHLISYTTTENFTSSRLLNKCPSQDPLFADIKIPKKLYPQLDHLMGSQSAKSKSVSPKSSISKAIPSSQSPLSSPIIAATPQSPISSPQCRNETSTTPIVPLLILPPISVIPRYVPGAQLHASRSNRLYDDTIALRHLDSLSFR